MKPPTDTLKTYRVSLHPIGTQPNLDISVHADEHSLPRAPRTVANRIFSPGLRKDQCGWPVGRPLRNFHVIHHTKRAIVRLANGDAYDDVSVLDVDKRKDIALLKIKAVDLPFLALGKSSSVQCGRSRLHVEQSVRYFANTLSDGIVSRIRAGDGYRYFQLTAPISHGSSGGPIFNANGEVIGIAVAIISEGESLNLQSRSTMRKGCSRLISRNRFPHL